jgi:hypothetical protein
MGNTTKWIPQTEKMKLVKRIQKMPETRDKHILSDVFIKEMSCKQVADSMKYFSNRGTPISHRQVINVVKGFYPEYGYSGASKGKGRPQNETRRQMKDLKFELIAERGCKCEKCGRLIHLHCDEIEELCAHMKNEHHFILNPARTVFYGICESCAKGETARV